MKKSKDTIGSRGLDQTGTAGKTQDLILGLYIFCYFLVSISFLTQFPFVHSDEAWLSGLTRNMTETGALDVTETFYDLKPRYPHGIKVLFHLLQMPMLAVFQYNIFAFRLLSLFFACFTLILFYVMLKTVFPGIEGRRQGIIPFLGTVFLSAEVQFIYASHFARQEIILLFCITACILAVLKKRFLLAGVITGLSIGLHPNSFLIGAMCAAMLLPSGSAELRRLGQWRPLLSYAGVTSAFAAVFIFISLAFDPDFFRHYYEYGNSEFDVGAPVTSKLAELPYFFKKIWYGVSGTYYVPDIRFELVLFALAAAFLLIMLASRKEKTASCDPTILRGLAGMLAGMVLIGRYNQTSIIFLFPLCVLVTLMAVDRIADGFGKRRLRVRNGIVISLILITAWSSFFNIAPWTYRSYDRYLREIAKAVEPDDKVLANLNAEYYFNNGKLLDYRNLSYLKSEGMTVEEYIKKNKIQYIILSDEMDLIYSQRPIWNMIYGNPRYMEELRRFVNEKCTPVSSFCDNTYGIRIIQYMNSDREFTVEIFKVKDLP